MRQVRSCRAGTAQMHDLLEKITAGEAADAQDLALLEELCDLVKQHQPVRPGPDGAESGAEHLRYFRNEYERTSRTKSARPASARRSMPPKRAEVARMSPAVQVKTLTIDGRDVGAREDQTILEVARENGI